MSTTPWRWTQLTPCERSRLTLNVMIRSSAIAAIVAIWLAGCATKSLSERDQGIVARYPNQDDKATQMLNRTLKENGIEVVTGQSWCGFSDIRVRPEQVSLARELIREAVKAYQLEKVGVPND